MATFSHLPAELVEWIYGYLAQPNLYAASQLNKSLHALAIPILYRHVDLFIQPGDKIPRIDLFCFNVLSDSRLAARVETIRLGPSSNEGVKEGQRWLPRDSHFDDGRMFELATKAMDSESLVARGDYFKDAIGMREYAAYAALIILLLPSLRGLHLADFNCASIDHVHMVLRNLNPGSDWNRRHASEALMKRLSSIKIISLNVDKLSGVAYPNITGRSNLEPILNLPSVQELEFSIPDRLESRLPPGGVVPLVTLWSQRRCLISQVKSTIITKLVVRHSVGALHSLQPLLSSVPQLQSLTYDFFYDYKDQDLTATPWIDLSSWSDSLPRNLTILVLSAEYCDTGTYPFKQPRIGEKLHGYLDLTNFEKLHTVEVPLPFLTGDTEFSITTEIYPLLPPNLRHLSLRMDMSHAQFPFTFDTSILPSGLTFQESEDEARCLRNARMDVSYMFHAVLVLLDFATMLETVSVWQPAEASLNWFSGQVADLVQACRNKSIRGYLVFPMLLRWKSQEHWNLVKEVAVYDPLRPAGGYFETFHRGERAGIPLGLASQYHLHALRNHQVRLR